MLYRNNSKWIDDTKNLTKKHKTCKQVNSKESFPASSTELDKINLDILEEL